VGETKQPAAEQRSRIQRFTEFLGTVPGLITAVVAVLVAVGGGYEAVTHVQGSSASPAPRGAHTAAPTATAEPTDTAEPADPPSDGPTPTDSPTGGATAAPYGTYFLSDTQPVSQDNYGGTTEATISHQLYPHTVQIGCVSGRYTNDSAEWTVGDATKFAATVGIADDASSASEAAGDLSFTDQDKRQLGGAVTVSLGHPQQVSFAVPAGTVRLRVHCASRDLSGAQGSRSFYVALGNAALAS
jgi:hypothetical protein